MFYLCADILFSLRCICDLHFPLLASILRLAVQHTFVCLNTLHSRQSVKDKRKNKHISVQYVLLTL